MTKQNVKKRITILLAVIVLLGIFVGGYFLPHGPVIVDQFSYQELKAYGSYAIYPENRIENENINASSFRIDMVEQWFKEKESEQYVNSKVFGAILIVQPKISRNVLLDQTSGSEVAPDMTTNARSSYSHVRTEVMILDVVYQGPAGNLKSGDLVTVAEPYCVLDRRSPKQLNIFGGGAHRIDLWHTSRGLNRPYYPLETGEIYLIYVQGAPFNSAFYGGDPNLLYIHEYERAMLCLSDPDKHVGVYGGIQGTPDLSHVIDSLYGICELDYWTYEQDLQFRIDYLKAHYWEWIQKYWGKTPEAIQEEAWSCLDLDVLRRRWGNFGIANAMSTQRSPLHEDP